MRRVREEGRGEEKSAVAVNFVAREEFVNRKVLNHPQVGVLIFFTG